MSDKDDIYKSLQDYFRFDKLKDVFMQIFEISLSILVGGLIGAWLTDYDNKMGTTLKVVTVASTVVLICFIINRLLKTIHFPLKAIEHLKASDELKTAKRELTRKDTINEFIDKAIVALNANTCPMTAEEEDTICETPLEDGIKTVLEAVINQTHYILECSQSKFTVIAHFNFFPFKISRETGETLYSIEKKPKTLKLRDDYNVYEEIFADNEILQNANVGDPRLIFYKQGIDTYNNYKFIDDEIDNYDLKLITSPLPAVCEGEATGVLFIVCDKCIKLPSDTVNILQIFGRLVSNWINNYENCIRNRKRSTTANSGFASAGGDPTQHQQQDHLSSSVPADGTQMSNSTNSAN